MKEKIIKKLKENIIIDFIELEDQSSLHSNHHEGGGKETHFFLKIKSSDFSKESLIKCHKIINNILKDEFSQGLHALSIKIIK